MRLEVKILKGLSPLFLVVLAFLYITPVKAQSLQEENRKKERETNRLLRDAEDKLGDNDFASAEASYREAVAKNENSVKARYNMANMYYGKEKPSQATSRLKQAAELAESKEDKHKIFHNMGNSFMEQKKYDEAVEAYKQALRNNPKDEETRYNLALAKQKQEKEDKEGGGGDDDQESEDKDQQEQDQNQGDEGDQEQEQDSDQGEDKKDQGGDSDEKEQEPDEQDDQGQPRDQEQNEGQPEQPQPGQLSPQQIKSLLEAMNNEEKKVQDKINAEKAKGAKTRPEKDW
jgi:Ca-activated chloride channel homolog